MITVTGKLEDATGAPLHATIDFVSKSTPLVSSGVVITNTDKTIRSDPTNGTFSVPLAAGNYQVTIAAQGLSTGFAIAVPDGTASAAIDTLVSSSLTYTSQIPNILWNGQRAGHITFLPLPAPPAPTSSEIAYTGGNIDSGDSRYAYCVSYVTALGETNTSPLLQVHLTSGAANQANRIFLTPNVTGVTAIHLWRTYVDNGHSYDTTGFPANIGLLATLAPSAAYYDDWESTAQFAARVSAAVSVPLANTTAGVMFSSAGNPAMQVSDQGIYFNGANARIKPGLGLQIYNPATGLWHTLLVTGSPAQLALDSGNPS